MNKYILSYDDCLRLDAARVCEIEAQLLEALRNPSIEVYSLPPGVALTVADVTRPVLSSQAAKHGSHKES